MVYLKDSAKILHLGILICDSGSSEDIIIPLQAMLDEYNVWRSVKMITSDITALNTIKRQEKSCHAKQRQMKNWMNKGRKWNQVKLCHKKLIKLSCVCVRETGSDRWENEPRKWLRKAKKLLRLTREGKAVEKVSETEVSVSEWGRYREVMLCEVWGKGVSNVRWSQWGETRLPH